MIFFWRRMVDIAILDSGVNPWHSHVGGIKGGLGFQPLPDGKVTAAADFSDHIGHGTAIAGIIRTATPEANLFAFKIFDKTLHCSAAVLLAALSWAIEAEVNMIHLSLGTVVTRHQAALARLSEEALHKNIIIVAAARNDSDVIYPAALDSVIGVYWDRNCPWDHVTFNPYKKIPFGAHGYPRTLPGRPNEDNFSGSSFAAAHVSAMAARILLDFPRAGIEEVKEKIVERFRYLKR
jgi:subtilisin